MIASLTGMVQALRAGYLVLDVNGVGYAVAVTANTSLQLKLGATVFLHTSFIVREDSMSLFGFLTESELSMFEALRSVTGVGPKSALATLNELSVQEIATAVSLDSDDVFRKVSGIGPKTAKLICVTLAGKLHDIAIVAQEPTVPSVNKQLLVDALTGLGWGERVASEAVDAVTKQSSDTDRNALLKSALAHLSGSKSVGA